jgi:hypothetical protein
MGDMGAPGLKVSVAARQRVLVDAYVRRLAAP